MYQPSIIEYNGNGQSDRSYNKSLPRHKNSHQVSLYLFVYVYLSVSQSVCQVASLTDLVSPCHQQNTGFHDYMKATSSSAVASQPQQEQNASSLYKHLLQCQSDSLSATLKLLSHHKPKTIVK